MSTTVQAVIDAALLLSFKNQPDTTATTPTELVRRVGFLLLEIFMAAADQNPDYFGTVVVVPPSSGGWLIPAIAESILRLERVADGAEVAIVAIDERTSQAGVMPAVYQRGRYLYPAGNAGDPSGTSDLLLVWCASAAQVPTAVSEALDERFPDRFVPILEFGLGAYLATKDGRADEATTLTASQGEWLTLFLRHIDHATANQSRHANYPRRFPDKALRPAPAAG